ncbi:hypothetical protein VT50_0220570 [Streptomyces antioxidans]|uniref:GNAT family N-acetyltransferase n=1 Tax=Streptomyces antioxidans TaxID=1507734 RepID=A0A1V4D319_9ACTN|nr:hypothetical protein [Streptomyces antioxidans]OPF77826.1 hypothetical protein VT50_0220570 [Streptomyces antioxidans]
MDRIDRLDSVRARPLCADDLPAAERASATTLLEADRRSGRVGEPEPRPRPAAASRQWIDRMRHFRTEDPGGCWVAVDESEGDDGLIGFAISQNRGPSWFR